MAGSNKLTEAAAKQAKPKDKSYRLPDGGGMYLEVMPTGSKYWRLKYRTVAERSAWRVPYFFDFCCKRKS